jgi:hypothetical protein
MDESMGSCEKAYKPTWVDRLKMNVSDMKYELGMRIHAAFWRILFFLKLGRVYSIIACEFGFYSKNHMTGICHWCGKRH